MTHVDVGHGPVLLTRAEQEAWSTAAVGIRINTDILGGLLPARDGSFLKPSPDDPLRKMAWWCHGYLEAAADHLMVWAELAALLPSRPGAGTPHNLRPAFTLARAAMESAAQTIWALGPDQSSECGRRFLDLVIWDLDEQTKAAFNQNSRAELEAQRDEFFAWRGVTGRTFRPPRYLDMIRYAASFVASEEGSSVADRAERAWRSTSGAAHGKQWPDFEYNDRTDVGDGLFLTTPQPAAIAEAMGLASDYLAAGVMLLAMRTGHWDEFNALWADALERLKGQMPPAEDNDR